MALLYDAWRLSAGKHSSYFQQGWWRGTQCSRKAGELTRWQEDRGGKKRRGKQRGGDHRAGIISTWLNCGTIITSVRKRIFCWFHRSWIKLLCCEPFLYNSSRGKPVQVCEMKACIYRYACSSYVQSIFIELLEAHGRLTDKRKKCFEVFWGLLTIKAPVQFRFFLKNKTKVAPKWSKLNLSTDKNANEKTLRTYCAHLSDNNESSK